MYLYIYIYMSADPGKYVGPEPEGADIVEQGFGWTNTYESGKGEHTITSGLEGAWTAKPAEWDNGYFDNLFGYEWEQTKSPAGAIQWVPTDKNATIVPDAHVEGKKHLPVMYTTDLSMRFDPVYGPISKRFHENPGEFAEAFAKAWYKLTHRDMGPAKRCLGAYVAPEQIWQDPVPEGKSISDSDATELKELIMKGSGCSIPQLVRTAWASACTWRCTDYRGGANGARVRLSPQKDWAANDPADLAAVLAGLEKVKADSGKDVSMADMIVLGGCAAIEEAAKAAGETIAVPFKSGRGDATDEQTDGASFDVLEPKSDGFRNYLSDGACTYASAEALLVDRAHMLNLSKAEMTALIGGMRALGANSGNSTVGVLTASPGRLSNDFFVNILDMSTKWVPAGEEGLFNGVDRATGAEKWKGSRVDLVFGSNSELRALAEYYASDDSKSIFVSDFVAAWSKVMSNDLY